MTVLARFIWGYFQLSSPEYLAYSIELTGKNKGTVDHCESHFIFDQPHLFKIIIGTLLKRRQSFHLVTVYIMWVSCGAEIGIKWQRTAKQKWLGLPHLQINYVLCGGALSSFQMTKLTVLYYYSNLIYIFRRNKN